MKQSVNVIAKDKNTHKKDVLTVPRRVQNWILGAFYILYGLEASERYMLILRSRVPRLGSPQTIILSQGKVDFLKTGTSERY